MVAINEEFYQGKKYVQSPSVTRIGSICNGCDDGGRSKNGEEDNGVNNNVWQGTNCFGIRPKWKSEAEIEVNLQF